MHRDDPPTCNAWPCERPAVGCHFFRGPFIYRFPRCAEHREPDRNPFDGWEPVAEQVAMFGGGT